MTREYDLWEEQWIPVLMADGDYQMLGLRELLINAHKIGELAEPAPTMRFGLYRLLIAVVADLLQIEKLSQLRKHLDDQQFDEAAIDRYRTDNEPRFRLFHPHFPFMQTAARGPLTKKRKPIAELLQHLPSGTFATHFRHGLAEDQRWSPAVCARALTAVPVFMTAGGAGYSPSINGAPPWYVLLRGSNLHQTLLLNTWAEPHLERGIPAWRRKTPIEPKEERKEYTYLEGLTWQPRLVQLVPSLPGRCTYSGEDCELTVGEMVFTFGLKAGNPEGWTDPAVPYRLDKKGRMSLKPREGRQAWRDYSAFALAHHKSERARRPRLVDQLATLKSKGYEKPVNLECYGLRTDNMKIFEWRHEVLEMPQDLFQWPDEVVALVEWAIDYAEEHARLLRAATKKAYPREGGGNRGAFDRMIERSEYQYWSQLGLKFDQLLGRVGKVERTQTAFAEVRTNWRGEVEMVGRKALELSLDQLGRGGENLRRAADARRYYFGTLKKKAG